MFDVGFSEMVMIGLVALLVIGPERLPKIARLAGFWLGKTRSMIASVKDEIKQELHAEEMRQLMQQQFITDENHVNSYEYSYYIPTLLCYFIHNIIIKIYEQETVTPL